jgi:hypothetical protein
MAVTETRSASNLTSLDILERAVAGGVTSENVAVVKEIIAMRREEIAHENKTKFNRAFFNLKAEIRTMNFYADKAAKDDNGRVAYRYCSEKEISAGLDSVLFKHGFDMLFSQRDEDGKTVAVVTLIHNEGHEFVSEFSVRSGATNRMKDATAADTSATTSAWRHLVIKMFGLKSRICESDDARNLGDLATKVSPEVAVELERRVHEINGNVQSFLQFAGAQSFSDIPKSNYEILNRFLQSKEKKGK